MRLLPIAALALVLAACGGGGGLSKGDLAKKANAICSKAEKDANGIEQPSNIQDADAAAKYLGGLAPILQKQIDDLKALEPADSLKGDWDTFIEKEEAANDLLQSVLKKAKAKDASGLQDLQKLDGLGQAIDAPAKKVGATSCT